MGHWRGASAPQEKSVFREGRDANVQKVSGNRRRIAQEKRVEVEMFERKRRNAADSDEILLASPPATGSRIARDEL